jgi:hypothetical protein
MFLNARTASSRTDLRAAHSYAQAIFRGAHAPSRAAIGAAANRRMNVTR